MFRSQHRKIIDPSDKENVAVLDQFGNVLRTIDGANIADPTATSDFVYDGLDRLRQRTSVDGEVATQELDHCGRLVSTSDPNTGTRAYFYNGYDELKSTMIGSDDVEFSDDALGRLTSVLAHEFGHPLPHGDPLRPNDRHERIPGARDELIPFQHDVTQAVIVCFVLRTDCLGPCLAIGAKDTVGNLNTLGVQTIAEKAIVKVRPVKLQQVLARRCSLDMIVSDQPLLDVRPAQHVLSLRGILEVTSHGGQAPPHDVHTVATASADDASDIEL